MKGITGSVGCDDVVVVSVGHRSNVGCRFCNPTAVCESEVDN